MPRVYLAGPMTGLPRWNFPAFESAAFRLRLHGFDVWSPAERDLEIGFDPASDGEGFDLRAALEADVEALLGCDVIALLPGWEDSPGVAIEILAGEGVGVFALPVADLIAAWAA